MTTTSLPSTLRLACLGDSWISDWCTAGWKLESPFPKALALRLEKLGYDVELVSAGFPGGRVSQILELAGFCTLRTIASFSSIGSSLKGDIREKLDQHGLAALEDDCAEIIETVDLVFICLGCNDLNHGVSGTVAARHLLELRQLYIDRGIEVVLVTIGGSGPLEEEEWPDFEMEREQANALLLSAGAGAGLVLDCDLPLVGLDPPYVFWKDGWHLRPQGYTVLADRLVDQWLDQSGGCILQRDCIGRASACAQVESSTVQYERLLCSVADTNAGENAEQDTHGSWTANRCKSPECWQSYQKWSWRDDGKPWSWNSGQWSSWNSGWETTVEKCTCS